MKKIVALAVLAAVAAASTPAEAKVRLRFNAWGVPYFETYSPHRWRRPVPPPEVYGSSYYDDYGDPAFDESYYDPYYLPPSQRPLPPVRQKTVVQKKVTSTPPASKVSSKPVTASKTSKPLSNASVASTQKSTGSGSLSCDKANKVVADYGFSSVKSTDCSGQVYEFAATRDGKNFLIKVSAASGELTEVKKAD